MRLCKENEQIYLVQRDAGHEILNFSIRLDIAKSPILHVDRIFEDYRKINVLTLNEMYGTVTARDDAVSDATPIPELQ